MKPMDFLRWIESRTARKFVRPIKFHPLPGGLEPLGKRRKESAESGGPPRAERAGARESLGRVRGSVNIQPLIGMVILFLRKIGASSRRLLLGSGSSFASGVRNSFCILIDWICSS